MFARFSYLSKKLEPVQGFLGFPEDFSFTLDMALQSKFDNVVEQIGLRWLGFTLFFPVSILAVDKAARSFGEFDTLFSLFLSSAKSRISLLHPSVKCKDLLTCKIFCFST